MAEQKVAIKIKTATYIDGELAKVKSEHTVPVSVARNLFAIGKAVPAEAQDKKPGSKA
jgi:hypothetical protein